MNSLAHAGTGGETKAGSQLVSSSVPDFYSTQGKTTLVHSSRQCSLSLAADLSLLVDVLCCWGSSRLVFPDSSVTLTPEVVLEAKRWKSTQKKGAQNWFGSLCWHWDCLISCKLSPSLQAGEMLVASGAGHWLSLPQGPQLPSSTHSPSLQGCPCPGLGAQVLWLLCARPSWDCAGTAECPLGHPEPGTASSCGDPALLPSVGTGQPLPCRHPSPSRAPNAPARARERLSGHP